MRWFVLLLSLLLVGCSKSKNPDTLFDYTNWSHVIEKPHFTFVPGKFAADCVDQSTQEKEERGPHAGHAISIRVNPVGFTAFQAGQLVPVGTVVVKEKFLLTAGGKDAQPVAVAFMIKHEAGYNAAHGDWEYVYPPLRDPGEKIARGKLDSCIDCHQKASKTDYLFREYTHKW
jgi:Cytochrome P460